MTRRRVLKLGGSLLTQKEWPARLQSWLHSQPAALNLLIVGGGEIVEAVRELDEVHRLNGSFTHWLCIDLLSSTLQIANHLLPEVPVIANAGELHRTIADSHANSDTHATYLVHVNAFYGRTTTNPLLPEGWSTTSDALAAWLALQVDADELVLFKSVSPPAGVISVIELADLGIVDRALVRLAEGLQATRIVNLNS